ncbi:hypothetical protein CONLIGDRAFT_676236 [Coniochaeta ligniaria NRRL 30616]|uniref:Extracellular matrix protein n=1 Tax=Coniochaeta ligniaria NRRL 30616 TaxID=1408157 RepID=A0A1J7J593_9PEZI|nr:hypothetical protein CONLIGDRAFT_676236 [Coniochaeta ligniaria NRRL 30616]
MRLSALFVAALAAIAEAKVAFTNSQFVVEAGQPFELKWTGADGPVTITLKNGPNTALKDVMVIDQNDSGTSFTWTPPSTLPSDLYAFEIVDSTGVPNYSIQWNFQGTASASVSTGSSTVTSGSSTSTSVSTTTSTTSTTTNTSSTSSSKSSSSTHSSSTTTRATSTSSTPTATPANTNDGLRAKSPLALVLVTVVALLYFN